MVNRETAGFRDWIVQRVTAVVIGAYALFLFIFCLCHQPLEFDAWQLLFQNTFMRVATLVAVGSMLWHAWIGLWTVFTDYIHCKRLRLLLQILLCLLLIGYFAWILDILF